VSAVVGWDARKLFDGGIGTYVRCLLSALARHPQGHAYVAALDPRDIGRVPWPGAVREVPVVAGKYGLAEHWVIPRALRAAGATLLHAPHYTLPMFWRGPAVVTIHDLIHLRFPQFYKPGAPVYARAMAGAAAAKARVVIADSEFTRHDVIERLRVPESKVRVVHLAVPEGLSRPAPEAIAAFVRERQLPPGYVLYVGARKAHKNLALLLRAIAAMPAAERPPLVLSGEPWPAGDALARLAVALGVSPLVRFAGATADDDAMSRLYAGAALYAHPALCEGFGLPPLEAMACGTPVLSSDAGSLAEVLGEAAELLPPEHAAAWAEALARLLGDSSRRDDLVRRGHAQVLRYSWARAADETRAIYREAMG
jgi:glycosyltransferase involved in cell wall biosynthesis